MLKKCNPIGVAVLFFLTGCEFFSTREILPRPQDIRSFQGLSKPGDSLLFQVTESLREPASQRVHQVLANRRLALTFLGDSLVEGKTWKHIAFRLMEVPSGIVLEKSQRLLDYSGEGLIQGSDSATFAPLPMVFFQGWSLSQNVGLLDIRRDLSPSTDTLPFHAHSEATWKVAENISDRGSPLMQGQYWYGASGLLKVEQIWPHFGWRAANASDLAADLKTRSVNLHRTLVRL